MGTAQPENRAPFSLYDVLAATGGELIERGAEEAAGVSINTRTLAPGNVFVALRGDRFDGHQYAAQAAERGARILIVERPVSAPAGVSVVRVEDSLQALGWLGRAHRRRWEARASSPRFVVAITGSVGKTTTRVATTAALRAAGAVVHASAGNLNNAVGVPLTLLGLLPEHQVAVVEAGTSSRGEIAHRASLTEPDVGVLTRVAAAHTEGIGTVEDVATEKGALFAALPREGVAVGNADDPRVVAQMLRSRARTWCAYGHGDGAAVRILEQTPAGIDASLVSLQIDERWAPAALRAFSVRTPLLGVAGAYAVAAASAVAAALSPRLACLRLEALPGAFASIEGEDGRLRVLRLGDGTVLLDDSYNANRASMEASLRTAADLARHEGRRLLAVLGEIRELGALSAAEHRAVGEAAASCGVRALVAVGGDAAHIAAAASSSLSAPSDPDGVTVVSDADAAVGALRARLRSGDVVLIKGSRGVGLERVVAALAAPPPAPRIPPLRCFTSCSSPTATRPTG